MKGFTRISSDKIREHCSIYHPTVILVLDESLIGPEDVCEGLAEGGSVIINTKNNASAFAGLCRGRIWTVDATTIALDEIGRPIPNMPMVGALLKVTGVLGVEELIAGSRASSRASSIKRRSTATCGRYGAPMPR